MAGDELEISSGAVQDMGGVKVENMDRPDEVSIHVNGELVSGPEVDEANYDNLSATVERPADDADREDWVAYLESRGVSREHLDNETTHARHLIIDSGEGEMVRVQVFDQHNRPIFDTIPALDVPAMIDLADQMDVPAPAFEEESDDSSDQQG